MKDDTPISPGDLIKSRLQDRGWTQADLAAVLGRSKPVVNGLVTNRTAITPETAIQLAAAFGDSASEWMSVEGEYRLSLVDETSADEIAARAKLVSVAPVEDMVKRGWIAPSDDDEKLTQNLLDFFGAEDFDTVPELRLDAHKTKPSRPMSPSERAWCFRAWNLAPMVAAKSYTPRRLELGIETLASLTAWPESVSKVPMMLSDIGVRLVIVEPLPRSQIDGVAFWLDAKSPVIAMSCRYDRIDNFWHVLGHELSHLRHKDSLHVDTDISDVTEGESSTLPDVEERANREAARMWIPDGELDRFIERTRPFYSKAKVNKFASRLKVHPGIIVGQLHHRGELNWGAMRPQLAKIRSQVVSTSLVDGWGHAVANRRA